MVFSLERNNNFRAAATYNYNVKGTNTGGRLLRAEVREVHQFTPFNEIDGAVVVEARYISLSCHLKSKNFFKVEVML